jgi:hypothetical protein
VNAIGAHGWNYTELNCGIICSGLVAGFAFVLAGIAHWRGVRKHRELHSAVDRHRDEMRFQIAHLGGKIEDWEKHSGAAHGVGQRETQLIEDLSRIRSLQ